VWVGGLSQLAWALVPGLRAQDPAARRALAAHVVPRFGRIALPAFMVVLVAGVVNAAIELGSLPALWNSGYGRVLLVKGALVLAVALASYAHALRLRPRVAAGAGGALERRHWRILAGEPALGVAVVLVTALLVAYSPPNRPAAAAGHLALPTATAAPSAAVAPGQLAVAAQAGNAIVAAWVSHARGTLAARVRVLDVYEHPARFPLAVHDGRITARCGRGCYLVSLAAGASALEVSVREHGRAWRARLPARFVAGGDRLAARLAARVGAAQGALRSAVVRESLAGGATVPDLTVYRLRAPDRFAYQLRRGPRPIADTIIIGRREWNRAAGQGHWQESSYGPQPFSASSYLTWWGDYTDHARLLERGGGYAEIATLTEVPGLGPVWLRLRFDTVHGRLLDLRMITVAHFMHQSWTAFNRPVSIAPPAH